MKIPSPNDFLPAAKAWAALVGAVVTALLGTVAPDSALFDVLTAVSAVTTAIAVYRVPNKRKRVKVDADGWIRFPHIEGPITAIKRDDAE